jgi:iron complex transport system substrate-binding protein
MLKRFALLISAFVAIGTVTAPATAATAKPFPVTVKSGGFTTTVKSQPKRIVSLSPAGTEILFGVGAGKQVVAVDSLSNYPAAAPKTDLSAFTPSAEAIAAYRPDLVLMSADATKAADVRSGLAALGIPVFMEKAPTDLNGAYAEMLLVGKVTGRTKEAQVLVVGMKKKIAAIIAKAKITKPIRFFHELDNGLYSVTSETFIGQVYKQIAPKSVNIADAAATADSYGYPQLSAEYLVSSNPQVIFLADAQYGEDAKTVAARAGYSALDAVKNGNVVALPADVPSRWGPRLVNLYSVIAAAMAKVK